MTTRQALFVGDVGMDLTVYVERLPDPDEKVVAAHAQEDVGGVVANAVVACSLAGAESRGLFAVGTDTAGAVVVERLRRQGVTVTALERCGPTCRAIITVDAGGEKRLVLVPGVSMYPTVEQIADVDLSDVGWVHTACYDPVAATKLTGLCRSHGIRWSVDLEAATLSDRADDARPWLDGADTVFVNQRTAARLGDSWVDVLHGLGVRDVVATLGPGGATLHSYEGLTTDMAPPSAITAPVIDTTGAGDALAGWYVGRRLAGDDPGRALAEAVGAGSISCLSAGGQVAFPSRSDVVAILRLSGPIDQPLTGKANLCHLPS